MAARQADAGRRACLILRQAASVEQAMHRRRQATAVIFPRDIRQRANIICQAVENRKRSISSRPRLPLYPVRGGPSQLALVRGAGRAADVVTTLLCRRWSQHLVPDETVADLRRDNVLIRSRSERNMNVKRRLVFFRRN